MNTYIIVICTITYVKETFITCPHKLLPNESKMIKSQFRNCVRNLVPVLATFIFLLIHCLQEQLASISMQSWL